MNIKAAAATLCLVTLVACSENKDESASNASAAPESNATQVKQATDGQNDIVEMDPGPEIADQVLDTQANISDAIEPSNRDSDESGRVDVSVAPNTMEAAVRENNVVSSSVENTKVSATYTIKPGDTLGAIASLHKVTIGAIVANNNLTDRDSIRVGQQLVIKGR